MARQSTRTTNGKNSEVTMSNAIDQVKEATSSIYDAVGAMGSATTENAKLHLEKGKLQAQEASEKAEGLVREKPLMAVGLAFAAGWLVSRYLQSSGK